MTTYRFYCVICGTRFKAKKKHARTCSTKCRVILSKVMNFNIIDDEENTDKNLSDEEKTEVKNGLESVRENDKLPLPLDLVKGND